MVALPVVATKPLSRARLLGSVSRMRFPLALAPALAVVLALAGCLGQSNAPPADQGLQPTDNGAGTGNSTTGAAANGTASANVTAGASTPSAPAQVYDKSVSWAVNPPADEKFSLAKPYSKLTVNVTQDGSPGVGSGDISIQAGGKEVGKGSISFAPTGDGAAPFQVSSGVVVGDYTIKFGGTAVGGAHITIVAS